MRGANRLTVASLLLAQQFYYTAADEPLSIQQNKGIKRREPRVRNLKKGSSSRKSKKGKKSGGKGGSFQRTTILISGTAASGPAILPVGTGPSTDIGTIYPFSGSLANPQNINDVIFEVSLDGEEVEVSVNLDGYCTRTGDDSNSISGYCHFTWSFYDPESDGDFIGSFTGQGALPHSSSPDLSSHGSMTIIGGSGVFKALTGVVEIDPGILDSSFNPPMIESLPEGEDVFDDVDVYLHTFALSADEEFVVS